MLVPGAIVCADDTLVAGHGLNAVRLYRPHLAAEVCSPAGLQKNGGLAVRWTQGGVTEPHIAADLACARELSQAISMHRSA